jgi:tetratricopeptide (TPR) repeat protein
VYASVERRGRSLSASAHGVKPCYSLGVRLVAACTCISLLWPTFARADEWDLTRPANGGPRAGSAPHARGREPKADVAKTTADDQQRARYLRLLLADPAQRFAFDRLLQLYRARDGNLDGLATELAELATNNGTAPALTPSGIAERVRGGASLKGHAYALVLLRAQVDAARGERDAARAGFDQAAALAPASGAALLAQAQLERQAGDAARAAALLERALGRAKTAAERALVLRELAQLALAREDYATAEHRFAELSAATRGGTYQATEYARALTAAGQHARAVSAYEKAIAGLRGDDRVLPPVLLELSRAQLAAGDAEGALASLGRARKLAPAGSGARSEIDQALLQVYRQLERLSDLVQQLASSGALDADQTELLGRIYDELGDPAQALQAYRRALALRPHALEIRERVIAILAQQGELDSAISEYRALLRAAPREPRYVIELAKLLFASGKRPEALRLLDQTAARLPRDARIQRALLDVYSRWGEQERATARLAQLSRIEPEDPTHVIALGEQLLARGDQEAALGIWRKILTLGNDKARAHATLGATYLDHDMAARALPEYEAAVQLEPQQVEYLRGLAETLEKLQRSADAAGRWQQVLELATDRTQRREARRRVVRLWATSGELAQRVADLERTFLGVAPATAASRPKDGDGAATAAAAEAGRFLAEGYRALASGRRRAGGDPRYFDAAERVLARVLVLEPGDIESMLALERLRTLRGNLAGAIEVLQRLLEADPKNAQTYLTRLSQTALALYRDEDAIAFAERLVAQNPADPKAHERLGDLYRARQNLERAIASYERAVALDENAFSVHMQLAELYAARGDARAAGLALVRVVRACPDDDLVKRAARSLIQLDISSGDSAALEQVLLQLAIGNPGRPIFRALLVELYDGLTRPLLERAREHGAEADRARAELRAIGQRAVKPLLEALADSDDAQRRIAIDLLGQIQSEHTAAALLGAAERAGDGALRRRALLAAGAVAPDELSHRIAALARVEERRLRDAAAWALARIHGPNALLELRALLASNMPAVRAHALLGLGRAHDAASLPAFRQALRSDPSGFVRGAAALALGMAGDRDTEGGLATAMRTEQGQTAAAAALALGLLGDGAAAESLAEAVFSNDAALRVAAMWSLRWLASEHAALHGRPPEQPEPEERPSLAPELSAWLALEPSARTDTALAAFERELCEAAQAALLGPPVAARVALSLLSADDPLLAPTPERSAFLALRASLSSVFAGLGQHPDPVVRAAAVALVAAGAQATSANSVVAALDDGDEQVQSAALDALTSAVLTDNPAALTRLSALARTDPRWWIRRRAVAALGRVGGERAIAPLAQILSGDAYAYVREAAATALGQAGARAAEPKLAEALANDPEPRVRLAAQAALRTIGAP